MLGQLLAAAILAEAAIPATARFWRRRELYDEMIGPDLRSTAFQVLSALTVPENRSARGNMAPAAKAFHNQRPQAIAATGFPQPARAPRRAADRMDPAAMPRSSKAVRKAVTYRDHRRRRPRPHPLPFSLKTATGPATIVSRRPHGHRPCTPAEACATCRATSIKSAQNRTCYFKALLK